MFSAFTRYLEGIGVEANKAKAKEWAERYDKCMEKIYNEKL